MFRRTFDAACRLARIEMNIKFEIRTPHTLMAMAEDGHGVAIIPSAVRAKGYMLRIASVTFQSKPLREPIAISGIHNVSCRAMPRRSATCSRTT